MTVVFFDLDDTLMNHAAAERAAAQVLHTICSDRRFWVRSAEEFLAAWRRAEQTYFGRYLDGTLSFQEQRRRRVCAVLDSELHEDAADALFAAYLEAYEASWCLFPDVQPCLQKLRSLEVGIISNGDGDQQRRKLAALGLSGAFDPVIISGDVGVSKPDHGIFLEACRRAGVEPKQAVYVGDRCETDAIAANHAGLVGVWLNREGLRRPEGGPNEIRSLVELPRLLE